MTSPFHLRRARRVAAWACLGALVVLLMGCATTPTAGGDLRGFVQFLEAVHPRPYTYVEPDALHAVVEEEAAALDALAAPDDLAVGLAFHRVLSRIGDGHLAIAVPAFQPGAETPLSLLPVVPKRIGASTYVDAAPLDLPVGTLLRAIDGLPIDTIWETLAPLVLVDGARADVQREAVDRSFAHYFHLAYGMHARYRIEVVLPEGEERVLEVDGVSRETLASLVLARRSAPLWGARPEPGEPPWPTLLRIDAATVLLRMPSFGIPDQEEYERRVAALFVDVEPSDTLVLDLRGNEGGLRTLGIAVLNRVLDRPYVQWARMSVRVRAIPDFARAEVTFPYVPEDALTGRFMHAAERDGRFTLEGDPLAALMQPTGSGHSGRVVVFIDGATNSAAVEMVAALRAARPSVVMMGSETGGECGRHIGEIPVLYTTPTEGMGVLMSLAELEHVAVPGCTIGRGFLPDYPVTYDERSFLEGIDPYLAVLATL